MPLGQGQATFTRQGEVGSGQWVGAASALPVLSTEPVRECGDIDVHEVIADSDRGQPGGEPGNAQICMVPARNVVAMDGLHGRERAVLAVAVTLLVVGAIAALAAKPLGLTHHLSRGPAASTVSTTTSTTLKLPLPTTATQPTAPIAAATVPSTIAVTANKLTAASASGDPIPPTTARSTTLASTGSGPVGAYAVTGLTLILLGSIVIWFAQYDGPLRLPPRYRPRHSRRRSHHSRPLATQPRSHAKRCLAEFAGPGRQGSSGISPTRRSGTVSPRPSEAPLSGIMRERSAAHYLTNVKFPSRSYARSRGGRERGERRSTSITYRIAERGSWR
jgi:hypothetical protein